MLTQAAIAYPGHFFRTKIATSRMNSNHTIVSPHLLSDKFAALHLLLPSIPGSSGSGDGFTRLYRPAFFASQPRRCLHKAHFVPNLSERRECSIFSSFFIPCTSSSVVKRLTIRQSQPFCGFCFRCRFLLGTLKIVSDDFANEFIYAKTPT